MKRKEIENLNGKLEQIKKLEQILKEITGDGENHWWAIKTPNKEIKISDSETRLRFNAFIRSEIEILKKEISLED